MRKVISAPTVTAGARKLGRLKGATGRRSESRPCPRISAPNASATPQSWLPISSTQFAISVLRSQHDDERPLGGVRVLIDAEEHHAAILQPHVRIHQRARSVHQLDAHHHRLVAHRPGHHVQQPPARDGECLARLPHAAAPFLAHDLEGAVADQAPETRAEVDELRVGGAMLGGAHRRDLHLERERVGGGEQDDRRHGEPEHHGARLARHWPAGSPSALTMMSVVPFLRSRRSSKWPLESMRSITVWFGRGRAATRAGSGLRTQRTALAATASATPHAGTVRSRRRHSTRASWRSMPRLTAGHTRERSSASVSAATLRSIASWSAVSSRTAASQAVQPPAWRATASSMGAGSSASTKASSSASTSPHVMTRATLTRAPADAAGAGGARSADGSSPSPSDTRAPG